MIIALLVLGTLHALATLADFAAAVLDPGQLDYGEGIVWQQAVLLGKARMYSPSQALPFIVFHYPPLYYLVVGALGQITPDLLMAGRAVSSLSALLLVPCAAAMVLCATRPGRVLRWPIAIAAGLLTLCLWPLHAWAMLMRVDLLAILLALAGMWAGSRANGSFVGTSVALLICLAAVFTKQTELPAGIAVGLFAVIRNPRGGLCAALCAGAVGIGLVGALQYATGGGFLQHVIGYNINRFSWQSGAAVIELARDETGFAALGILAFAVLSAGLLAGGARPTLARLRSTDRAGACRSIICLHFVMATLAIGTVLKSGASINYLIEWLAICCVLIGILLSDMEAGRVPLRAFAMFGAVLLLSVAVQPMRLLPDTPQPDQLAQEAFVVQQIAAADLPVLSENMSLLMRAHKQVVVEPAIVAELAALGKWDETPLVDLIRRHGFAFVITSDDRPEPSSRWSSTVKAAIVAEYSRVEEVNQGLWIRRP